MTSTVPHPSDTQTADRAAQLHAAGAISRFVLAAARMPAPQPGPGAWSMARRLRKATEIVNLRWRTFQPPSHVERELTADRLLAIRIVSFACGWRDMHRLAVAALSGDERSKRRLRRMLAPRAQQIADNAATKAGS